MRFSKVHLHHHPFSSERSMKNAIFFSIFSPSTYFTQDTLLYTHSTLNNLQFLTTFFSTIHSSFPLFCFFYRLPFFDVSWARHGSIRMLQKNFFIGMERSKQNSRWYESESSADFVSFFLPSQHFVLKLKFNFSRSHRSFEQLSTIFGLTKSCPASTEPYFFVMWSVDSQSIIIKLNRPPLLLLIADFIKLLILLCKFWVCSPPETYFSTSSPLFFTHSRSRSLSMHANAIK